MVQAQRASEPPPADEVSEHKEPKFEEKLKDMKKDVIDVLNKLLQMYKQAGCFERGKAMGFQRAITNVKAWNKPITSASDLDKISCLSPAIKSKVLAVMAQGNLL